MTERSKEPYLTDRQERTLLKAAAAAAQMGLPNSELRECPRAKTIRDLARRRIPLRETGELVDHIATCSRCFAAYTSYRSRYRSTRVAAPIAAAVLSLLCLALLWWNRGPRIPAVPNLPTPQTAGPVLRAIIDYRAASPTRSGDANERPEVVPHLVKGIVDLVVLLPFGAEDGDYSIEIRGAAGEALAQTNGTARWTGKAEELIARVDLRQLAAGRYALAIRHDGASWRAYQVILEDLK